MDDNRIIGDKKDSLFFLTINRPDKRNALSFEMMADIAALVTHLDMEVVQQSIMMQSEDFKEGMTALVEKRDPVWKGR